MTAAQYLPWHADAWRHITGAQLHHAFLLKGRAGIGAEDFAEALATLILCLEGHGDQPCGRCRSCEFLAQGQGHPDIFRTQGEGRSGLIPVEAIRALEQDMRLTSLFGGARVALIANAERLHYSAANALLKILEEPPGAGHFILISHRPDLIPVTVRSRCLGVGLPVPEWQVAADWLAGQLPEASPERTEHLLDLAGGAPLEALHMPEEALSEHEMLREDMRDLLTGRGNLVDIASRWAADEPVRLLTGLLVLATELVKLAAVGDARYANSPLRSDFLLRLGFLPPLRATMDCYRESGQALQDLQSSSNLNAQYRIQELLLHWSRLAALN